MSEQRELPKEIYEICDIIVKSVQPERVYLFGSYAYGTPREDSDYDFYVVLPDDYPMRRRDALNKIILEVQHTGLERHKDVYDVDILAGKKSILKNGTLPTMIKEIARDGIVLYECSH